MWGEAGGGGGGRGGEGGRWKQVRAGGRVGEGRTNRIPGWNASLHLRKLNLQTSWAQSDTK